MRLWRNLTAFLQTQQRNSSQNGETRDQASDRARSLRYGLSLTISLALLPIAVVSAVQGFERARLDIRSERVRIVQAARALAAEEEGVLLSGEQALQRLSQVDDVRNVSPYCDRALATALIGLPAFSNLSRLNSDGVVVCSALAAAKGLSARNTPLFDAAKSSRDVAIGGEVMSKVTHRPVIGGMLALRDISGRVQGALGFALDVHWLDSLLSARHIPDGAAVAVFDRNGSLVATNNSPMGDAVARASHAATAHKLLQSVTDSTGSDWTYSSAPLLGGQMRVALALPQTELLSPTYVSALLDFALPVLMIALSWVAIWYAAERQITQWIAYLRRIIAAYGGGHYSVRPSLEGAPSEFLLLGNSMAQMADGIVDRDRRLREALAQKTLLIREIHHRVKNNLQIVISLLRLQADQLQDPTLREALGRAQARINALALVHRLLHEVDDQTAIDLERLVSELADQMSQDMGGRNVQIEVRTKLSNRKLPGELAVPVALFAVEALSNALRHAFPIFRQAAKIQVHLQSTPDGGIRLTIEDNGIGFDSQANYSTVGLRLLRTFAYQLGGTACVASRPGEGTTVTLVIESRAPEKTSSSPSEAA